MSTFDLRSTMEILVDFYLMFFQKNKTVLDSRRSGPKGNLSN